MDNIAQAGQDAGSTMLSATPHHIRPIETLRDAIYRGDWAVALDYEGHRDPVVREYADVVQTISPTIRMFWTRWRVDSERAASRLEPYADRVLGTNLGDSFEVGRQWMILDWLIREWAPSWLALRDDLVEEVAWLRSADPIGPHSAEEMERYARQVRDMVWKSSRVLVRGHRGREASQLACDAVRHTGLPAAWDAVFGPTRGYLTSAEARVANVGVPAMNAARDVAWDAALNVARTTALHCLSMGGLEAPPLAGTIRRLQASVLELMERLIALGARAELS